jgi:hypothetical protein
MSRSNNPFRFSLFLTLAFVLGATAGCKKSATKLITPLPTATEVVGLTEANLRLKYPEVTQSFGLLVSKHLHPYHPPLTHKLLRFGQAYLVAEIKGGTVIALHRVEG